MGAAGRNRRRKGPKPRHCAGLLLGAIFVGAMRRRPGLRKPARCGPVGGAHGGGRKGTLADIYKPKSRPVDYIGGNQAPGRGVVSSR